MKFIKPSKKNNSLLALVAAATSLPGMQIDSHAEPIVEEGDSFLKSILKPDTFEGINLTRPVSGIVSEARYSHYRENDDDRTDPVIGLGLDEIQRYTIDVYQAGFIMPLKEKLDLQVEVQVDEMSGASHAGYAPGFIVALPDPIVEIKSKASISDTRYAINGMARYYSDKFSLGAGAGFTYEEDYISSSMRLEGNYYLNDKNTTLSLQAGFSNDTISPAPESFFLGTFRVGGEKNTKEVLLGVSQVLGKNTVFNQNVYYRRDQGFLSDPYRVTLVLDSPVPAVGGGFTVANLENRPNRKETYGLSSRLVQYVPKLDSSFHFDYRYLYNNWHTMSHTFEMAYYQPLPYGVQIVPRIRYYTQSDADFFSAFWFTMPADLYRSSDKRLSEFGSIGAEMKIFKQITENTVFDASFAYYRRDKDYKLGSKKYPGGIDDSKFMDFSYWMISFGIQVKF